MSDAEAEIDEEPVKKKGLSGKKLVLFIILPVLLLLGGGGGGAAYYLGYIGPKPEPDQTAETDVIEGEAAQNQDPENVVFYDLPDMLVNLNTGGKQSTYLKLRIALELQNAEYVTRLETLLPRVVDNFQVYLRELRREDLSGSAGIYRLREELVTRVNSAIYPAAISDVLFREMLVQ